MSFAYDWLSKVKAGYGEKFSVAFDEVGLEDQADIDALSLIHI